MTSEKRFPDGREPLGKEPFSFRCHPGVRCFTVCCRNVDLDLYPYDIIRLKRVLKLDSETFLRLHAELKRGGNPFFPTVKLRLQETGETPACPFLAPEGCQVYRDRPTACRTYPLERAVDRSDFSGRPAEFYFLTRHEYCFGHHEDHRFTVAEWVRNQRLDDYNLMNDLWARVETIFAGNPWRGEGTGGNLQQLAFMACYNVDGFRRLVREQKLLDRFRLDRDWKRRIERDDTELLKFGFEWLAAILGAKTSLVPK